METKFDKFDQHAKSIFALLVILSMIVGFFTGAIPSEMFTAFVSSIITYFYKDSESKRLEKQLDNKSTEVQAMNAQMMALSVPRKDV